MRMCILSNAEHALGGHAEEGCTVLTFAIVAFADTPDTALAGWDKAGDLQKLPYGIGIGEPSP